MQYVFEFAQARLQSDPIDGRQLLWFREPLAYFTDYDKEDVHRRIIEWLYNEFLSQVFGLRQWLSATQFIERIGCKYEGTEPNDLDFAAVKVVKKD